MSKNITIQENGVAKTVTVDKLNTKLVETGDCNWVPEDAFKVGTLKVWRNGTFNASDFGVYGFDKVIVVSGSRGGDAAKMQGGAHLGEIRPEAPAIKEGGKAVKLYGVHHVSVNKSDASRLRMMAEPLLTVDSLTITKTGAYRAYEYGKYGFSQITVNIPDSGGGGGGTLPDEIRITRRPDKTEYVNGETIDVTGMVVTACRDGKVWKSDEYPRGVVPLRELALDPAAVDVHPIEPGEYLYSAWYQDVPKQDGVAQLYVIGGHMITIQYGARPGLNDNAWVWIDGAFFNELYAYVIGTGQAGTVNLRYRQRRGASDYTLCFMSTYDPATSYIYDLVAYQGEVPEDPAGQSVKVSWRRPGDGRALAASFDIDIIPQEAQA